MAAALEGPEESAPSATPRRALALDALRGLAILGMCLSGVVPWEGLPSWMYHAQFPRVPGETVRFDPTLAGYTWVDLVFPVFLFAMGAAIPLALRPRVERGVSAGRVALGAVGRGSLLFAFAVYAEHITPHRIEAWPPGLVRFFSGLGHPDPVRASQMTVALVGFGLLFPVLARLPSAWSPQRRRLVRFLGYGAALAFLLAINAHRFETAGPGGGSSLQAALGALEEIVRRSDIILLVLANLSVLGTLAWLVSRDSIPLRLAFLGLGLLGHAFHLGVAPTWLDPLAWTPAPWLYQARFAKYLLVVVPGTIAGDALVGWMRQRDPVVAFGRPRALLAVLLGLIAVVHAGLQARWGMATFAPVIAAGVAVWQLTPGRRDPTEALLRSLSRWSVVAVVVGLGLELVEMSVPIAGKLAGGIKKDPSTLAYYAVSLGLATALLAAFIVWIDVLKHVRSTALLVANGQNPMLAYVGIRSLLAPLVTILPIDRWVNATLLQGAGGWARAGWSATKTWLLARIVAACTRRGVVWRS